MFAEPTNQELCVFVWVPNHYTGAVKVRKSDMCGTLKRFCGHDDATIFHNGQPLDSNSTFGDYNINQRDHILIINNADKRCHEINRWMNVNRDSDDFNSMVRSVMNQKNHREVLRRMDNSISKMEVKPRSFRKMIARYTTTMEAAPPPKNLPQHETIILPRPDAISEDPLPVPW